MTRGLVTFVLVRGTVLSASGAIISMVGKRQAEKGRGKSAP